MTAVTFVSIKGAPGVTTLSCLVGATWPEDRRVAVVEADPFGGDLAARFQLSVLYGWTSYAAANRRSVASTPVDPHLQPLPGGLEVLVGAGTEASPTSVALVEALLESSKGRGLGALDLLVDCGRMLFDGEDGTHSDRAPGRVPSTDSLGAWLDRSDLVVVVTRRDPPSILKVRERAPRLSERCGDRLRLVVVGRGPHDNAAIQEFTGLPVIGEVPFDILAGQVAAGGDGARRHLSHSQLVVSARRLAVALATPGGHLEAVDSVSSHDGSDGTRPDPRAPASDPDRPVVKTRSTLIARIARVTGQARSRHEGRSSRRRGWEVGPGPALKVTLGTPPSTPPSGTDPDHLEQGARR